MSSQPHDKTGKHCFLCKKIYTDKSATFTISFKEPGLIVKRCVCAGLVTTSTWRKESDVKKRIERLMLTFVAKKYVAWVVATALLVKGFIIGAEWVALTTGIFIIDAYTKKNTPSGG